MEGALATALWGFGQGVVKEKGGWTEESFWLGLWRGWKGDLWVAMVGAGS